MAVEACLRVVKHVARVALAVMISTATFELLVTLDRTILSRHQLLWFIWPLAIGAGYIPLWRWYPRDAYPIGLVFCPAMFFFLKFLHERFGLWTWSN